MRLCHDRYAHEQSGRTSTTAQQPIQRKEEQADQQHVDIAQMQFAMQVYYTHEQRKEQRQVS